MILQYMNTVVQTPCPMITLCHQARDHQLLWFHSNDSTDGHRWHGGIQSRKTPPTFRIFLSWTTHTTYVLIISWFLFVVFSFVVKGNVFLMSGNLKRISVLFLVLHVMTPTCAMYVDKILNISIVFDVCILQSQWGPKLFPQINK